MKPNFDNYVKSITLARKKGVLPCVIHQILKKNTEIESILIDGVKHYDLNNLPDNFLVRRKENVK